MTSFGKLMFPSAQILPHYTLQRALSVDDTLANFSPVKVHLSSVTVKCTEKMQTANMPSTSTSSPSSKIPVSIARTLRPSQPRVTVWRQPFSRIPVPSRILSISSRVLTTIAPLVTASSISSVRSRHVVASFPRASVPTRVTPNSSTTDSSLASRRAARDARARPWLINSKTTGTFPPEVGNKNNLPAVEVKTDVDEIVRGMAALQVAPAQKKLVKKLVVEDVVAAKEERVRKLRDEYANCWRKANRPVEVKPKVSMPKRDELIQARLDKERRLRRSQVVLKPALKSGLEPTPILQSEENLAPGMRACFAHRRKRAIPVDLADKQLVADEGKYEDQEEPLYEVLRSMREAGGDDAGDTMVGKSIDDWEDPDPRREVRVRFALKPQSFVSVVDRPDVPTALFGRHANPRTYWTADRKIPQREDIKIPEPTSENIDVLDADTKETLAQYGYGYLKTKDPAHIARTQLVLTAFWTDDDDMDDLSDLPLLADALFEEKAKMWDQRGAGWEAFWESGGDHAPEEFAEMFEEWKRRRNGGGGEPMEVDAADAGDVADEEECETF